MRLPIAAVLLGAGVVVPGSGDLWLARATPNKEHAAPKPKHLKVAVVQMALGPSIESNRDRIVNWIPKAAARGARVVVFPEGALSTRSETPEGDVPGAVAAIREAAHKSNVYVLYGGWTWSTRVKKNANWMEVVSPKGEELFHYDKLWDIHDAATPGVFHLDGVAASAVICADRWLRGLEDLPVQAGAQISFELANNFGEEWVPELGWYWYVPRAMRNNVWVVFANSGNRAPGKPDEGVSQTPRHGHSVVVAPDGSIEAAANDDLEAMVVADLDIEKATRSEAIARGSNAVLGEFWKGGLDLLAGKKPAEQTVAKKNSAQTELTVAAAQFEESADWPANVAAMVRLIGEASGKGADLVAFPELAVTGGRLVSTGDALERIRAAAKAGGIAVAFGMPVKEGGSWRNSGFVVGPKGEVLTRYDQISAKQPFKAGERAVSMWFELKGVPGVVTIGRDGLWNEIAELAAVAGARLHVHLSRERVSGQEGVMRRRQIVATLASFSTLTVAANAGGASAIWDDLSTREETRAFLRGQPIPNYGKVKVLSLFSANLVEEAGDGQSLVVAGRRVPGVNPHYPQRTANFHPAAGPWYLLGGRLLAGKED